MAKPSFWGVLRKNIVRDTIAADDDIREGRFQKSLALIAGLSSVLSGLEVTYEHYRGSYSRRVMYSPVILSGALLAAGIAGFLNRRAARTVLPVISGITLADSLIGFVFHVRGIQRKPGGWRLPIVNIIMGPPIFAPLLFGISGYLGLIAAFLRREDAPPEPSVHPAARPLRTWMELTASHKPEQASHEPEQESDEPQQASHEPKEGGSWEQDIREGRFQKHLAASTAAWSLFSGVEALYSHYKNNFRYKMQWTPIVIAPVLTGAAIASVGNQRAAKTLLPAASLLAIADGTIGFYYHVRGVARRPGGMKKPLYNIMYGPPVFAPLLFAACGSLGLLASLLRREK